MFPVRTLPERLSVLRGYRARERLSEGRVQYACALLDGKIDLDRAFQDRMLDCLNCMRCGAVCPSGVRTDRIVLAARAELARRGKLNFVKK